MLAFVDNLPAGVVLATPASATADCGVGASLSAPSGGSTITFSGGSLAGSSSCQVAVDVIGTTAGSFDNTSGDLTSSAGNSGTAFANLTVNGTRILFSKSFAPAAVQAGATSRLTFSFQNPVGAMVFGLTFGDPLPPGLQLANPVYASNTCFGMLAAPSGGTAVSLTSGAIPGGASCSIGVDVEVLGAGDFVNRTTSLTSGLGVTGFAIAELTASNDPLAITKVFVGDPLPPGATLPLRFIIQNFDRDFAATDIAFTDDLDATLSGLMAVPPLPTNPCGAGSTLSGTNLLSLTGGTLPSGGSCTFQVDVQIPGDAMLGTYPNTTSDLTATIDGNPATGSPATDDLQVLDVPVLTKTFLTNPVAGGDMVDVEFTLTNTSSSSISQVTFTDELADLLSGTTVTLPANNYCGAGSTTGISFEVMAIFSNISLAANASCTFQMTLQIPLGAPAGTYTNTTSTVGGLLGGEEPVTGPAASDDLTVVAGPELLKSFVDDPTLPGDPVTLEFTLTAGEEGSPDIDDIAFTDDLGAALAGLMATVLPPDGFCGPSSHVTGGSVLSFTGASLAGGDSCSFQVTVLVPAGALPGAYTNTTSPVTATSAGLAVGSPPASDDLDVAGLNFAKSFTDDPAVAGGTVTLQFTVQNVSTTATVTNAAFTDDLNAVLSGLTPTGLPLNDVCGLGSQLSATGNTLMLTGGNLAPSTMCTFSVVLQVPAATPAGTYDNATSSLTADFDGNPVTVPHAIDTLTVVDPLSIAKDFTDDPAAPGGTVTLQFTLTNVHPTEAATGLTFTDDLDAALTGLQAVTLPADGFCGAGSHLAGTSTLTVSNASLPAASSCTFSVTVQVPAAAAGGTYLNMTSTLGGTVDMIGVTAPPASAPLVVVDVGLSKSFASAAVPGGTVVLTFTLDNLNAGADVTGLAFTDDLSAVLPGLAAIGLPMSDVCGAGSQISGTSLLTFTGGSLPAGGSCSFPVTLQVPGGASPGSYPNTTSALSASGLSVGEPATDTLAVEPPPAFAKAFAPAVVPLTGISTLTFTIDNGASSLAATGLSFTDDLPAGVVVAPAPAASTTCTGGTLTAGAGTGSISYTGGSVSAGASCTVQADVTSDTAGTYVNTSGALTSSSGDSGTAMDTLDVVGGEFAISKSFTDPVLPGGTVSLQFTIVTGATFGVSGITFTDDLDATLSGLAAVGLPADGFCGAGSQLTGTSVLTLSGANLPAGSMCTFTAVLGVPAGAAVGGYTNTTSTASGIRTGGQPTTADPATAPLEVVFLDFAKSFADSSVKAGQSTTLSFTLSNPDAVNGATQITFSDDLDAAVPGMVAVGLPQNDVCGAGSQLSGTSTVTLTAGSLPAGGSCTFDVTVMIPPSNTGGDFTNVTSTVDASVNGNPVAGPAASAASAPLTVVALVIVVPTLSIWGLLALALLVGWLGWKRLA